MKAATGELNLTLITVVALAAVLALFTGVLWPQIKEKLINSNNEFTEEFGYIEVIKTDLF